MSELLKIIVTDSAGVEHIFNEAAGETENYLDLQPTTNLGEVMHNAVQITTRSFGAGEKAEAETDSIFINPRRVDVIY